MSTPPRFREISVAGTPREMGRQIGEAAGEEVRAFCDRALAQVNKTMRVSRDSALQLATECISLAELYSPDMVDELRGIAEAARVSLVEVMLLQVRNQLRPDADAGCTSLSFHGASGSSTTNIVAQNWDNDPELDAYSIVLTRRPTGKPAMLNVTQAGLIAYIGLSEAGMGVCLNTLPAPSRRLGVPHYFTVRGIYEAKSLDEAVTAVRRATRAIPANIMLATPDGPADLEVTINDVHVLRDPEREGVTHANHALHPDLVRLNDEFPQLIQSHERQSRIDSIFAPGQRVPRNIAQIKAALRDHQGHPRSICRHQNDDAAHGLWQTVWSVI
ncbi:MAG: peptidase C45, partial [Planctomycetaceae bacterium]|nr:peptidase C45 [Planctomycetaceae bacterium]